MKAFYLSLFLLVCFLSSSFAQTRTPIFVFGSDIQGKNVTKAKDSLWNENVRKYAEDELQNRPELNVLTARDAKAAFDSLRILSFSTEGKVSTPNSKQVHTFYRLIKKSQPQQVIWFKIYDDGDNVTTTIYWGAVKRDASIELHNNADTVISTKNFQNPYFSKPTIKRLVNKVLGTTIPTELDFSEEHLNLYLNFVEYSLGNMEANLAKNSGKLKPIGNCSPYHNRCPNSILSKNVTIKNKRMLDSLIVPKCRSHLKKGCSVKDSIEIYTVLCLSHVEKINGLANDANGKVAYEYFGKAKKILDKADSRELYFGSLALNREKAQCLLTQINHQCYDLIASSERGGANTGSIYHGFEDPNQHETNKQKREQDADKFVKTRVDSVLANIAAKRKLLNSISDYIKVNRYNVTEKKKWFEVLLSVPIFSKLANRFYETPDLLAKANNSEIFLTSVSFDKLKEFSNGIVDNFEEFYMKDVPTAFAQETEYAIQKVLDEEMPKIVEKIAKETGLTSDSLKKLVEERLPPEQVAKAFQPQIEVKAYIEKQEIQIDIESISNKDIWSTIDTIFATNDGFKPSIYWDFCTEKLMTNVATLIQNRLLASGFVGKNEKKKYRIRGTITGYTDAILFKSAKQFQKHPFVKGDAIIDKNVTFIQQPSGNIRIDSFGIKAGGYFNDNDRLGAIRAGMAKCFLENKLGQTLNDVRLVAVHNSKDRGIAYRRVDVELVLEVSELVKMIVPNPLAVKR